jgi:hypothetical protein
MMICKVKNVRVELINILLYIARHHLRYHDEHLFMSCINEMSLANLLYHKFQYGVTAGFLLNERLA